MTFDAIVKFHSSKNFKPVDYGFDAFMFASIHHASKCINLIFNIYKKMLNCFLFTCIYLGKQSEIKEIAPRKISILQVGNSASCFKQNASNVVKLRKWRALQRVWPWKACRKVSFPP